MSSSESPRSAPFSIWTIFKLALFALVLTFVVSRAMQIWKSAPPTTIRIEPLWLVLAGIVYLVGWLPSAWIWRALIRSMNQPLGWKDALRAYYVGHLGKYVPGKALVLVIRGALLREAGIDPFLAGSAVVYETLILISTGAAWGLALAPLAFGEQFWSRLPLGLGWLRDRPVVFAAIIFISIFATTPFSSWLFTKVGRKLTGQRGGNVAELPSVSAGLICQAVVLMSLGWGCHALSLGLVLRALVHQPMNFLEFPIWMAATTISTVGGFLVLVAPGGIGVREGLLIEILKSHEQIGPATAVVLAALLRGVWFAAELTIAAALYVAGLRRGPTGTNSAARES
jgi:glycosyltransferase 2 family protein